MRNAIALLWGIFRGIVGVVGLLVIGYLAFFVWPAFYVIPLAILITLIAIFVRLGSRPG